MRLVLFKQGVAGENVVAIAMRLEHQHRNLKLVDAQMQDRIVEFTRDLKRPERGALRDHALEIGRRRGVGRLDRYGGDPLRAIDVDADEPITHAVIVEIARQWRQGNPSAVTVAHRDGGELPGALGDLGLQLAVRHGLVDEAPLHGALAFDSFLAGAEIILGVTPTSAILAPAGLTPGAPPPRRT